MCLVEEGLYLVQDYYLKVPQGCLLLLLLLIPCRLPLALQLPPFVCLLLNHLHVRRHMARVVVVAEHAG